jgi:apolipoprotein N-acyltransferase
MAGAWIESLLGRGVFAGVPEPNAALASVALVVIPTFALVVVALLGAVSSSVRRTPENPLAVLGWIGAGVTLCGAAWLHASSGVGAAGLLLATPFLVLLAGLGFEHLPGLARMGRRARP